MSPRDLTFSNCMIRELERQLGGDEWHSSSMSSRPTSGTHVDKWYTHGTLMQRQAWATGSGLGGCVSKSSSISTSASSQRLDSAVHVSRVAWSS